MGKEIKMEKLCGKINFKGIVTILILDRLILRCLKDIQVATSSMQLNIRGDMVQGRIRNWALMSYMHRGDNGICENELHIFQKEYRKAEEKKPQDRILKTTSI